MKVEQDVMRFISGQEELKRHFAQELDCLKRNVEGRLTKLEGMC